ncbi:MAG: T9SS type A sorting domain-containing protein [Bacteroidales bacterium]|nr:T9SS type A sorting domain-containing protein [Bacteroidales bacterium]
MKKYFISLFLCTLVSTLLAQRSDEQTIITSQLRTNIPAERLFFGNQKDATYRLTDRLSSDHYEAKHFWYDAQGHVIAMKDSVGDYTLSIDSMTYDAYDRVVRIDGYQYFDDEDVWKHVYYVNYAYDANGNMIQRTNFNSFGTANFEQGGVYDYQYDSQNRLVHHDLYLGNYSTLIETGDYFYNTAGQIVLENYMQGYGSLDSSLKVTYEYNAEGRKSSMTQYYYEGFGWEAGSTDLYLYDAYGNCIEHSVRTSDGEYSDRRFYEYNTYIPSSEVSMPYYIPELYLPEAFDDAHLRNLEHWYTWDADHVLQYVCDYIYLYNGQTVNVETFDLVSFTIYPNPTYGIVHIDNLEGDLHNIEVYDLFGHLLSNTITTDGQIDLTSCPAGVYIVKARLSDGRTIHQKLVRGN